MTVSIDITFRERFGMMLIFQSPNVLNHMIMGAPNFSLGSPRTFVVITASACIFSLFSEPRGAQTKGETKGGSPMAFPLFC